MTERHYVFELICPRCKRYAQATCDAIEPIPHLNCGDCLMERARIVEMTVERVFVENGAMQ